MKRFLFVIVGLCMVLVRVNAQYKPGIGGLRELSNTFGYTHFRPRPIVPPVVRPWNPNVGLASSLLAIAAGEASRHSISGIIGGNGSVVPVNNVCLTPCHDGIHLFESRSPVGTKVSHKSLNMDETPSHLKPIQGIDFEDLNRSIQKRQEGELQKSIISIICPFLLEESDSEFIFVYILNESHIVYYAIS